jgi:hypothetical protein
MAEPIEILQQLTQCWCDALALSPGGAPGKCCMVASDPVIPVCCDGFAWVRMTSMTPFYPKHPGGSGPSRCVHPMWKMAVELGIARCAPPICGDGLQNPCCENEADAVNVQFGDFAAFSRALGCCLPTPPPGDPWGGIQSDQITIFGFAMDPPSGGCVTGRGTATIQMQLDCSCE